MAGLLDFLKGGGGGENPLTRLLAPEVAMPMAGALMGGGGNMQNFGQAFMAGGQALGQQNQQRRLTAQKNQSLAYLQKVAPEYAQWVEAGVLEVPDAFKAYLADQKELKAQKPKGIINAGSGNLYDADSGTWLSAPGGGAEGIAGLQPVWLQDENGQPVLGQMTKDGKVIRSQMDKGLTPVSPYQKSFETGRGGAEGKTVGEAAGTLPAANQMAGVIAQQVKDLKNDPALPNVLGAIDSRTPNIRPDSVRVQSKIDQLKGGVFLQARQMLKGGGAITDYEGQKAEEAFARLNQAQDEGDFKAALDDFNYFVQQGLQKLEQQAGQQRMGSPQGQGIPAPGANLYKDKYGLD